MTSADADVYEDVFLAQLADADADADIYIDSKADADPDADVKIYIMRMRSRMRRLLLDILTDADADVYFLKLLDFPIYICLHSCHPTRTR